MITLKLTEPRPFNRQVTIFIIYLTVATTSYAAPVESARKNITSMVGCYLVDYNYTETEGLKEGYARDQRLYDVNSRRTVKEWIYSEDISPTRLRLQHILFSIDRDGKFEKERMLRHQAEDWEVGAPFLYEFQGPANWAVRKLTDSNLWTRRITNLDDGLRYQCAAPWSDNKAYPEWSCAQNYAPIPGRETRDMGRKDYQGLLRGTRLILYGGSWLERQNNTKMIQAKVEDAPAPLAKELGRNWYIRLPDSDCKEARTFAQERAAFWTLLRQTWDKVLAGDRPFIEKPGTQPARYEKITDIQETYFSRDLTDPRLRAEVENEILTAINAYRATN